MDSKLPPIPEDVLIAEFQNLTEELGHTPSAEEIDEKGRFSAATYDEAFESLDAVAEKAEQLADEEPVEDEVDEEDAETAEVDEGPKWSRKPRDVEREAYIREIRRLYNDLGRVPETADITEYSCYSIVAFNDQFLSHYQAIVLAGLDPLPGQRPNHEHLLTILQRLGVELDRIPEPEDMDQYGPDGYDSDIYIDAFRSWSHACFLAGLYDEFRDGSLPWEV